MRNVRVLECTLRDGGRVINCEFPDDEVRNITRRLADAKLDIIEVGFLRDSRKTEYKGNTTFFTDIDQITPFLHKNGHTLYVAFIDFGMFDFSTLKPYDGTSIDGIRFGFTQKNYKEKRDEILECARIVKEKGYKLFIQGVNSISYSDRELLEVVDLINEIHPYSFGMVDTYGAMYQEDVDRIYGLIDNNLEKDICIDFHSHNNYQLSFAFAMEVIRLSKGVREIILDSTLLGMGKGAGNLNTELIIDYLVRILHYDYDFDGIMDIIDDYIYPYADKFKWGYSIPAMLAGVYKSHQNNILYLTDKFRLATKDIKYIISMIDPQTRLRYDYDNLQRLYQEYNHTKVDDSESLKKLSGALKGHDILLLLPGSSIVKYKPQIIQAIEQNGMMVIMVNFIDTDYLRYNSMVFWGSTKRYERFKDDRFKLQSFMTSNVESDNDTDWVFNYDSYIDRTKEYSDNTMLMLLRILHRIGITTYSIAGFDGFSDSSNNYVDNGYNEERFRTRYDVINKAIADHLKCFAEMVGDALRVHFISPSIYQHILEKGQ
ncbi:MAG: aldolase catalytic domain-containing protein [Bacteroidales bacterium]|nr:aldolase catalytic domain-containing protein [Bacteroidales bacterium]